MLIIYIQPPDLCQQHVMFNLADSMSCGVQRCGGAGGAGVGGAAVVQAAAPLPG